MSLKAEDEGAESMRDLLRSGGEEEPGDRARGSRRRTRPGRRLLIPRMQIDFGRAGGNFCRLHAYTLEECTLEEDLMFKKVLTAVLILMLIAVVVYIAAKSRNGSRAAELTLVKVQRGDIEERALAIGRIEPEKEIAVKSKISGIVRKIYVEVGDRVRAGQPLVEIKPDPTPLEFAEAKRNVEMAAASNRKASSEYERMKQLFREKMISPQEFEAAENEYRQAGLRLNLAEERLALIERGSVRIAGRMVDTVIKSPVDGTVLERRVNEGDPVVPLTSYQAGTELFILADMEKLIFKGTVDEIDVGKLNQGMEARLKIGAIPDEEVWGKLVRISPKARKEENATLFDVEIEITRRGNKILRAGYSSNAELLINRSENALIIPERLVRFQEDKTFVEVQNENGEAERREIKVGLSDGINVEVLEGLEEGDEVIERPPKEIK